MNSIEIGEEYNKENSKVMRTIKSMLKRNPELSSHYHNTYCYDTYKRKRPIIEFDDIGEKILRDKFKYNIRNARFEYKMMNEVCDYLDEMNIEYIRQYQILNYKIDLFLPSYNLCIEYDEKEHKYKKQYDKERENSIKESNKCIFIRIEEKESVGTAIAKIIKCIS